MNGKRLSEQPLPAAFDALADRYDRWYENAEGAAALQEELACLRFVCPERRGRWLEVGVGTGRFASALGIVRGSTRRRRCWNTLCNVAFALIWERQKACLSPTGFSTGC